MKRLLLLFAAVLLFAGCHRPHIEAFQGPVEIFEAGVGGYNTYRIPSLCVTKAGTILAFAEGRTDHHKDHGNIDLVLKRSTDGGRSWGELIVARDDGANCCSSPTPVVLGSGRILLLSTWKTTAVPYHYFDNHWFCQYSDDDGLSWSEPREIGSGIIEPEWIMSCIGPGHAIRLTKGPHKGRVVVPGYHKWEGQDKIWQGRSYFIYSDDDGQTWHQGGFAGDGGNECMATELSNGDIMLNQREFKRWADDTGIRHQRLVCVSSDGGESFGPIYYDEDLPEAICEGSIIRYLHGHKKDDWLLFANPEGPERRDNFKVKLSRNRGEDWEAIYEGPYVFGAYSDMAELPSGEVALIYEAGDSTSHDLLAFDILPAELIRQVIEP